MSSGRVLVYGGRGGLGSVVVSSFKAADWWVLSIDSKANEQADENVLVDINPEASWLGQEKEITEKVGEVLSERKLDSVINVAGGWAGGSANKADFIKNCDLTWRQSVWTSTIAARLASLHLKPSGGLLVLPGADPARGATPGMIGYGLAKAAVHQLTKSLADVPKSGLPEGTGVYAILPVTLDTPMNRKWMPKADTSTWTPLEWVADLMLKWSSSNQDRPNPNGSLVRLVTEKSETKLVLE